MKTSSTLPFFTRMLLRRYPDYDINRHYYISGDIVRNVKTQALCYIIESAVHFCNCIIIKPGFGMSKGAEIKISYDDLEYFERGKYIRPPYPISKRIYWEAGDIVCDEDSTLLIRERPESLPDYVYAIILETDMLRVPIGGCFAIKDPYFDYHGL